MAAPTYRLRELPVPEVPWAEIEARPDATVFQSQRWFAFLAESKRVEPIVAAIEREGEAIGWLTAATTRRFGIRMLGSPLRGWTTSQQGFVLAPGVAPTATDPGLLADVGERAALLAGVQGFAFATGHRHVELLDARFADDDPAPTTAGWAASPFGGYVIDLARSPDDVLEAMSPHGRRDVRRALRNEVTVTDADRATFAADYLAQLTDVFAKQGRRPPYDEQFVDALLAHLGPADLVLPVARDGDGRVVATGIFPGSPAGSAWFWGGASWRDAQHLLPNEAVLWHGLTEWQQRGARTLDLGGSPEGGYKGKFGGEYRSLSWMRTSRPATVEQARVLVLQAVKAARRAKARHLRS